MDNDNHPTSGNGASSSVTVRDLLAIGFRQQRTVVVSFLVICLVVVSVVLLWPPHYEAEMKILVKRERADPVVTPGPSSQGQLWLAVTEEELNSEVELLRSHDLLAKVVAATGLYQQLDAGIGARLGRMLSRVNRGAPSAERRIARAAEQLADTLSIQPLRKSNVIQIRYVSGDPEESVAVLRGLADHYLEKHLAVHRPSGAFAFFENEAERYRGQLTLVQARLEHDRREEGVVSVDGAKDAGFRRALDLEAIEQTTRVQIAETEERVRALEKQAASIPPRTTTEIRTTPGRVIEQLQATMTPLELKRMELLRVFKPTYPSIQEIDAQIAKLQAAIAAAKESPLVEETTNRDPTSDYLRAELAKNRSELPALRARASATAQLLSASRERVRRLEQMGATQQTLMREAKQAEDNYLVYVQKREEARISDALDAQRIVNVAIVEEATLPTEPSGPRRALLLLFGAGLAGILSVGLAFIKDYVDPSFRTPSEVRAYLGLPVLASMPRSTV
jgi:uncharacterized protein involved in exopolysaccharide biosynthesis